MPLFGTSALALTSIVTLIIILLFTKEPEKMQPLSHIIKVATLISIVCFCMVFRLCTFSMTQVSA